MTALPYSRIQAFSVETAGILDNDSELNLWFVTLAASPGIFPRDRRGRDLPRDR
jgi:hypothetical protein